MHDISLTTTGSTNGHYSSTPVRNARSEYFPSNADDGANGSGAEDEGNVRPFSTTTNISHVPPMRRGDPSTHDTSNLLDNDQASHHSFNNDTTPNRYNTTNYHYHNNASDDRTVNLPEGPPDIVGVVRPNNTRTVVDVEIPPEPIQEKPVPKKKKKGIMKVFKLCTGKSGQAMEQSKDDMYVKQEPARVTMTTYTNESVNWFNCLFLFFLFDSWFDWLRPIVRSVLIGFLSFSVEYDWSISIPWIWSDLGF